jgi:predicted dehydrogenase
MVTDWRSLSVLIVGCGSVGRRHARVLEGLGVSDLRACDPVDAQRSALAADVSEVRLHTSYEEGLAGKPDAVIICTPPLLHVAMIEGALAAGCHVLCEKPLAVDTAGLAALESAAAASAKKIMVALCFRYHEGLLLAKRYLDEGRIGRLVSVRAMVGEHLPSARPDYRDLFCARYLGAFDLIHEIDLALWYTARPVRRIACVGGTYSDIGTQAPDVAEIVLDFEGRSTASIHLDFFQRPRRRQTELLGTEGVIIVEFARWEACVVLLYEAARGEWEHQEILTRRDDMFRAEDREFLEAAAGKGEIRCTLAEGRKSVEVLETAIRQITK